MQVGRHTLGPTVISHSKPLVSPEDQAAVLDVLSSGMIAQGQVTSRFALALAAYLGPEGVVTSSGTAAITLVLRALGLAPGGEVIIPTYVCRSVGDAVGDAGLKVVLCDVGSDWNISPEAVAAVVGRHTVAIIVPHVFGIAQDVRAFEQFGVPVIVDACQSFGTLNGRAIGTDGTAGVFSFNAIKCLTTGEGGYVASRDPQLVRRMQELAEGHRSAFSRFFSPMTDMQAALGLRQLARYDDFLLRRRCLADRYFTGLAGTPVALPTHVRDRSMFFRFPVLVDGVPFQETLRAFERRGVAVRQGVDALLHRTIGQSPGSFPIAERLFRDTVSLPIYPAMTDDEQATVIDACREVWGSR